MTRRAWFLLAVMVGMLLTLGIDRAYGQPRACADGVGFAVNTTALDKYMRNYGAIDTGGECDWLYYSARTPAGSSYALVTALRAARVLIAAGATYVQRGDGSCFTVSPTAVRADVACPAAAPVTPPLPPPPVVVVPPPIAVPPAGARAFAVYVVPIQYDPPPAWNTIAVQAYNASVPKLANLSATMAALGAWWARETYGLIALKFTILPTIMAHTQSPACNYLAIGVDLSTYGVDPATVSKTINVSTYSCWQYHMLTSGNSIYSIDQSQDCAGEYAHEMGHAFGLMHAAGIQNGAYVEYGNTYDQMAGPRCAFAHFNGHHKFRLGVLSPLPCQSQTLRSLYDYPDAMRCTIGATYPNEYWADYRPDWNTVQIVRAEFMPGQGGGGSDNTLVAVLGTGQTYKFADGRTVTHAGRGVVNVAR
jgi:hypothetical protein